MTTFHTVTPKANKTNHTTAASIIFVFDTALVAPRSSLSFIQV
jgi:hypothetical protein